MNKIVCDVCGTSYPDTASQCPICGCVRSAGAKSVSSGREKSGDGYNHVKGGRFSKSNVKKRTKASQHVSKASVSSGGSEPKKDSKGLVITALVLLLVIIAAVIYIAVKFFMPEGLLPSGGDILGTTDSSVTTEEIPCEELKLDTGRIVFQELGEARMLYFFTTPLDTTNEVIFTSSDPAIATVNEDGKVTAIAPGTATITVTCGSVSATCEVECVVESTETADTTDTTEEASTDETVDQTVEFKLNRKDITFSRKGETWMLYDGNVALSSITWTSDNENVAKISNGTVTAVGYGTTNVHGELNGVKVSCIIRCSFQSEHTGGISGNVSEDGGGGAPSGGGSSGSVASGDCKIYSMWNSVCTDVTIKVGESFSLQLKDSAGNVVSASWSTANSGICANSGSTFTGAANGTTTITATYNGASYSCIVRVI